MWMSVPTPETTSIIVVESESTRNVQSSWSAPIWLHSASRQPTSSPWFAESDNVSRTEMTNAAPEARLATVPTMVSLSHLPKTRLISKPISGAKTSQGAKKKNPVVASCAKCIAFSRDYSLCSNLESLFLSLQGTHLVHIDT